MSPGPHAYIDMKYDSATTLGLKWAGLIGLRTAYEWDPATIAPGVAANNVLGVEAPLWAETLRWQPVASSNNEATIGLKRMVKRMARCLCNHAAI